MKLLGTKHKVRFDRGRIYWSYIQTPTMAAMAAVFVSDIDWKIKVASAIIPPILIYIFGWIDDVFKIINKEQEIYSEKNPVLKKILNDLDEIKTKLNQYEKRETKHF